MNDDEERSKGSAGDGSRSSTCVTTISPHQSPRADEFRVVICFHGSGSDPLPAWTELVQLLSLRRRVVLLDRGATHPSPSDYLKVLVRHLAEHKLRGPYVLLAHSYGGVFAKSFLHSRRADVAGLVLVETGKGGVPNGTEESMLKRRELDPLPLVVISGNSFLEQQRTVDAAEQTAATDEARSQVARQKTWLDVCSQEDKRLETAQLQLSTNHKHVVLPDCGHNVIRDRPDVVVEQVDWVLENYIVGVDRHRWRQ